MKKNKPYTIVFGQTILEHPSLIEMRADAAPDQWDAIVSETIDFYLQMNTVFKANSALVDHKGVRILRSLRRTIETIKMLDLAIYNKYYNQDSITKYDAAAQLEIKRLEAEAEKARRYNFATRGPINVSSI